MKLHLWARYDSGLLLALLGIAAALWTLGTARARIPALVTLAASGLAFLAGTIWFRDQFGDDPLATSVGPLAVEALRLEEWRRRGVGGRVADLLLSPTGNRVALRLTREEFPDRLPTEPSTFEVEREPGDFTRYRAWDLQFTGDHLIAVLSEQPDGLILERFRLWPQYSRVERVVLPRLKSPSLRVDRWARTWEVASTDFGRSESVLLRGRFGREGHKETRWTFTEPEDLYLDELRANSSGAALLVASRFDFSMFDYLPLFLAPLGSYATLSEMSAVEDSSRASLALTTLELWCVEPTAGQHRFVCGGNDREYTTWFWSIDAQRRTVTPVGSLAGFYHGAKFAGNGELLLQGHNTPPVVIDLSTRRARALLVDGQLDSPIDGAPGVNRAGFNRSHATSVAPDAAGHRSYQAMAKEGDVVALAWLEDGRSRLGVYRVVR